MRNMKKRFPALLLALGLALSMTACGNKESETVTPDNSTTPEAVETQPTQEATGTEETTSRDDTGVYPNATGLTEVAMGVTEDICTFRLEANAASIYITSVNGIAESGEIVNIDGNCNRVASIFYGHEKVYFVIGENKIEKDYDSALYRARNIAAPLNAQRLGVKTPCAIKADKCYDCKSPERICRGLSVLWEKPMTGEFEIILIHENLGY